jgi:hypothetical protein
MNTHYHAVIAAKKHGGIPEDYYEIYDFIDSSKQSLGDVRHRAILHSTFGIFLCERVFGHTITNSAGKQIPTRILAEEHIIDDLGFIPTVEHWLGELPIRKWMSGTVKKTKVIPHFPKIPHYQIVKSQEATKEVEEYCAVSEYKKSLKVTGD